MDRWIQIFPGLPENPETSLPQEVWSRVVTSMFSALSNRSPRSPGDQRLDKKGRFPCARARSPLNKAIILFHLAHWYMIIGDHGKAALARQLLQHLAKPKESLPLVILLARMEEAFQFQMAGEHEKCLRAVSDGLKILNIQAFFLSTAT